MTPAPLTEKNFGFVEICEDLRKEGMNLPLPEEANITTAQYDNLVIVNRCWELMSNRTESAVALLKEKIQENESDDTGIQDYWDLIDDSFQLGGDGANTNLLLKPTKLVERRKAGITEKQYPKLNGPTLPPSAEKIKEMILLFADGDNKHGIWGYDTKIFSNWNKAIKETEKVLRGDK